MIIMTYLIDIDGDYYTGGMVFYNKPVTIEMYLFPGLILMLIRDDMLDKIPDAIYY